MKSFSAQYIFTNSGAPLKRGIITTDNDGNILAIEDTAGELHERHSVEFYNGIIIPAFINCHCHLELSHMKGSVERGTGLPGFIMEVRKNRSNTDRGILSAVISADEEMNQEGIIMCADVCNTKDTFYIKQKSKIKYLNLLEVFGIDPGKTAKRIEETVRVMSDLEDFNMPYFVVPHSAYSLSLPLLRRVREMGATNKVTSIHFMETSSELEFLENRSGDLMSGYLESGLITPGFETVSNHTDAILNEVTLSGNLILVHNTFASREIVRAVIKRGQTFWCLCPNSNIYIENKVPPVNMLLEEGCNLVLGTDSLASNSSLSILEEMKTIQKYFPDIKLEEIIRWATLNGALALNENLYGSIEPGKRPGLLLLQDIDLITMKLLPETRVTRLI